MNGIDLSEKIQKHCNTEGITVGKFFKGLGKSSASFYNWKLGRYDPKERMVKKILAAMEKSEPSAGINDYPLNATIKTLTYKWDTMKPNGNPLSLIAEILKTKMSDESKLKLLKLLI